MKPRTTKNIRALYKIAQRVCAGRDHEYTGDPVGLVMDIQLSPFPDGVASGDVKRAMRKVIEDAIKE